tara:strand:+ start:464 stop:625 length:162 start_codon:yes stop_codon:yes gene_type:complete
MSGGSSWNTRPQEVIDAAKARAKAALKEKNPKLTALEKAFYQAFKNENNPKRS